MAPAPPPEPAPAPAPAPASTWAPEPGVAEPPQRRPRSREAPPANGIGGNETLLSVLEHLSTLSRLVTGTSRATTAELDTLGSRVEKAVAELDALQLRVLRSLAGFDALRLRVQKELADRPPLTDEDVERIADAVTQRLLDHVRVETDGGLR